MWIRIILYVLEDLTWNKLANIKMIFNLPIALNQSAKNFTIMKNFKTITFGMMCLFGFTVMAVEPNESVKSSSIEESAVKACSLTYSACDDLYPSSHSGFVDCMERGGC